MQTTSATIPAKSMPALWIILISFSMIVIDNSIVFTGLNKIQSELGFTDEGLSWISSIYALFFGGFLLLGARAGDLFGRRRVFKAGLVLFSAASLAICFAPNPLVLVISRAVQGIGAAIIAPATLALLQAEFPPGATRTRAISYYAAAGGVSASVGLVVGGLFAGWLSWRVGFFINVPIGLALIWTLNRFTNEGKGQAGRIDFGGGIVSTVAIGLLLFAIERTATLGWTDAGTLLCIGTGLVLIAIFVVIEARVSTPLMPLRLFAAPERAGAYAARALFLGANMSFYFYISQFMQGVQGMNAASAGAAFLPSTLVNFATAMIVARFINRFGNGPVAIVTVSCGLTGMILLALLSPTSSYLGGLLIPTILVGIGQGGTIAPLTNAALSNVAREDAGAVSGIINVAHQLGASLGIGIVTAYAAGADPSLSAAPFLAERTHLAMVAASAMMIASLAIVVLVLTRGSKPVAASA
ncbi:MFS transporter [Rhizobium sp. 2MFCol3.1]|uniref:MFS transporter n=1 Tax=Rhizobium sp. 2MFCol3.1 TaxID=1246459 RepID=UPI0003693381|nr:MFS transporter [Rhizobium sp. 2MFCol3.1]